MIPIYFKNLDARFLEKIFAKLPYLIGIEIGVWLAFKKANWTLQKRWTLEF